MPAYAILFFVLVIALFPITGIIIMYAIKKEKRLLAEGIEADAVVVRVVPRTNKDSDTRYYPYVQYTADDGNIYEASLNVRTDFPIGRKVRIKYLPPQYDYVAFVSQAIEPHTMRPGAEILE